MNEAYFVKLLNVFCPMHLVLDTAGTIVHAGPTLRKITGEELVGAPFLQTFEVKRPQGVTTLEALRESLGSRVALRLKSAPERPLQAVFMPGSNPGELVANLSFGISVVDAVRDFELTAADFAVTDLTVEMLYLVEAKSAAMEASRQLNRRLQMARVEAEELALTDTLTGLKNRRAMDQALSDALSAGDAFCLMHIDLDFFKAVNDTLGHAAGDHVLLEVARIMTDETRDLDVVARVGGDEFVILLSGTEDRDFIERIARRIISRLQIPIPFEDQICQISGSIGIVLYSDYPNPTADQLLGDADAALYAAKHAGRGCHIFFEMSMREATQTV